MPEISMRQTKEQERAKLAWELVTKEVRSKNFAGEYKSYVNSAFTLIKTNGLVQTLSFWKESKKKDAYKKLTEHLNKMVAKDTDIQIGDLLDKVLECSVSEYRNFTSSALACLVWLKRFAEAELED
ncbi:MAG: type III-B CRISPR module-associated protein Cmr5 [Candidatus Omnitrophica bacterium]|nr:type III-B CRISPR module-associated protein Cmr5 [Candidatus Omnitrophota bacterium]